MARIAEIVKAMFKRRGNSPGKSVVIQLIASGDEEEQRTTELWHPPGISSAPTKGDRAIVLPMGRGGFKVAVVTRNHRVEVEPGEGETIIYSTNAAGDTVQAKIELDTSGNVTINDGTKGAARTDDATQSTAVTDAVFWAWVTTISAAVNVLAPGSVPTVPTTQTGKITGGSSTVEVG